MAAIETTSPLTRASVVEAHAIVAPHIHRTPVITNSTLSSLASSPRPEADLVGTRFEGRRPANLTIRLWFKCENLQRIGAFKVRGAFHALEKLQREEGWVEGGGKERGVVTHSSGMFFISSPCVFDVIHDLGPCKSRRFGVSENSEQQETWAMLTYVGNHAQALALAARESGIKAHIVMPNISVPQKIAATKGYGARVIFSGSTSVEREAVAQSVIDETGARLVPPYDHPDIMLGQGTMGLELQEQVLEMQQQKLKQSSEKTEGETESRNKKTKTNGLNAIITPCGGGGMLSGVALSCEGTGIRVFGAEPSYQGADDGKRGYESGQRIPSVKTLTVADGLRTPVGEWPWKVIYERRLVSGMYAVTEDEIKAAMRLVLERAKVVVEPSACVGLAVALFDEDFRSMVEKEAGEDGWDLGVVFSGGNVGADAIGRLFAEEKK